MPVTIALGTPRAWAQSSPIRLVSIGDTSGVNANQDKPWIAGAQAVFDRANRSGGISGRPIELMVRDTGGKPKLAEELTGQSFANDKTVAFFGCDGGPVVKAMLPLIDKAQMPLVASFSGADELRGVTPFMFHIRPGFKVEVTRIVQQLQSMGINRVGMAAVDCPIGTGAWSRSKSSRPKAVSSGRSCPRPLGWGRRCCTLAQSKRPRPFWCWRSRRPASG